MLPLFSATYHSDLTSCNVANWDVGLLGLFTLGQIARKPNLPEIENSETRDARWPKRRDQPRKNAPKKGHGRKSNSRKKLVACNPKNARRMPNSKTERKILILRESVQDRNRCPQSGAQRWKAKKRRNRPLPLVDMTN